MINFSTPMTHCTLARQYGANIRNEHNLGGKYSGYEEMANVE